jgi:hypothetical protein
MKRKKSGSRKGYGNSFEHKNKQKQLGIRRKIRVY